MSNQIQSVSALRSAKDLVLEASGALRTSREVQWVSLSAAAYQDEVIGLTQELNSLDLELTQLEVLCGQLFRLLPSECWATMS